MDGILVQTTRSIRALIDNATAGAPAQEIDLAYHALLDQCGAAEREALRSPADPIARFDARAAVVLSVAYRPVLDDFEPLLWIGPNVAGRGESEDVPSSSD